MTGRAGCYGGLLSKELTISAALSADPSFVTPAPASTPTASARREHLRASLPSAVDLLHHRRAGLIGDGAIGEYVALHWLEWNGGTLRLTVAGQDVCDQVNAESRRANFAPGDA